MAGKGGLQRPRNPAPVSGPGALSRRTDGGPAQALRDLPNAKYGENSDFRDIESGAAMAASPVASGGAGAASESAPALPMQPPTPLTVPSQRPDEAVTHGAALGAGANSMVLPDTGSVSYQSVASRLQQLAQSSGNADIQLLAGLAGQGRF